MEKEESVQTLRNALNIFYRVKCVKESKGGRGVLATLVCGGSLVCWGGWLWLGWGGLLVPGSSVGLPQPGWGVLPLLVPPSVGHLVLSGVLGSTCTGVVGGYS